MLDFVIVRDARIDDREIIVEYNACLARETEGKELDRDVLRRGVEVALTCPDRLRYWMAETQGLVVGQSAVSFEWSDWRNGWIWWFQSVYVVAGSRNTGIFRALHNHIRNAARDVPDVIGLRLYVEAENHRAQQTYSALGMRHAGYEVYEEIWPDRFIRPSD